jgi:hypothetical protein
MLRPFRSSGETPEVLERLKIYGVEIAPSVSKKW